MTFWILPVLCIPIPRSSVILIQPNELKDTAIQSLLNTSTETVNIKIGNHTKYVIPSDPSSDQISLARLEIVADKWDDDVLMLHFEPTSEESAMEQLDEYIGSQVPLETKKDQALVKVSTRTRHRDGSLIGSRKAIDKEMTNAKVAFKFLGHGIPPPVGFTGIRCLIIFNVKMDLTRKARFVADDHMTAPPSSMTYASVVSRESVRIAFLLAALNGCEILAGDIGNAYTSEKIYYRTGQEWGTALEGTVCVIVRALYGLKSSANVWRTHFYNTLNKEIGFQYSYADNDFWMKKDACPDGTSYYTYILVYVDNVLIISHNPSFYMEQLKSNTMSNLTVSGHLRFI